MPAARAAECRQCSSHKGPLQCSKRHDFFAFVRKARRGPNPTTKVALNAPRPELCESVAFPCGR